MNTSPYIKERADDGEEVLIMLKWVIYIKRAGDMTAFFMVNDHKLIVMRNFDYFLDLPKKFSFLVQVNNDTIMNMLRIAPETDPDGNTRMPPPAIN